MAFGLVVVVEEEVCVCDGVLWCVVLFGSEVIGFIVRWRESSVL